MASSGFENIRKALQDLKIEKEKVLSKNQFLRKSLDDTYTQICLVEAANNRNLELIKKEGNSVKNLREEIFRLEQCLQDNDSTIGCLEKQYKEIESLKNDITKLDRESEYQINENLCLEDNLEELAKVLKANEFIIHSSRSQISKLEAEMTGMKNILNKMNHKDENLRQEIDEVKSKLQEFYREYMNLCSKLNENGCIKKKLDLQIQRLKKDLDEKQKALENEKSMGCKIQQQIKQKREEIFKQNLENEYIQEENDELKEEVEIYNKKIKQAQTQYQRVLTEYEDFKSNIEIFKKDITPAVKYNAPSINTVRSKRAGNQIRTKHRSLTLKSACMKTNCNLRAARSVFE